MAVRHGDFIKAKFTMSDGHLENEKADFDQSSPVFLHDQYPLARRDWESLGMRLKRHTR